MSRGRWNVWSKDPSRDAWMVVEPSVSERVARDGAARRTRTAERLGFEAKFMALPGGETPHTRSEAHERAEPEAER
jgi:hypothetical protein